MSEPTIIQSSTKIPDWYGTPVFPETDTIETWLDRAGFTRQVNPIGETELTSPDYDWEVTLSRDGWSLSKFTDSDIDTDTGPRAVGRYETVTFGEELRDSIFALRALRGALYWAILGIGPDEPSGEDEDDYTPREDL